MNGFFRDGKSLVCQPREAVPSLAQLTPPNLAKAWCTRPGKLCTVFNCWPPQVLQALVGQYKETALLLPQMASSVSASPWAARLGKMYSLFHSWSP